MAKTNALKAWWVGMMSNRKDKKTAKEEAERLSDIHKNEIAEQQAAEQQAALDAYLKQQEADKQAAYDANYNNAYEDIYNRLRNGDLSYANALSLAQSAGASRNPLTDYEQQAYINAVNDYKPELISKNEAVNKGIENAYFNSNPYTPASQTAVSSKQFSDLQNQFEKLQPSQIASTNQLANYQIASNNLAPGYFFPTKPTRTDAFGAVSNATEIYSGNPLIQEIYKQDEAGGINLQDLQKAYNAVNSDNTIAPTSRDYITNLYNQHVENGSLDPNKDYSNANSSVANTPKTLYDLNGRVGWRDTNWWGRLWGDDENEFDTQVLRDTLTHYAPGATDFLNSMSDTDLLNILKSEDFSIVDDKDPGLNNLSGKRYVFDLNSAVAELNKLSGIDPNSAPVAPTREQVVEDVYGGKIEEVNKYLADLQEATDRNTDMMQQQLNENQLAFDDYRSNLLSNQYQQNAQLMGQVGSEMSKARRNALEAGASAGLRMAENINTTLAMQNKQSQLSLETSNQLAQQLLNQRQASSGIRSNYNQMLNDNASEARNYKANAVDRHYDYRYNQYQEDKADWDAQYNNGSNAFGDRYLGYVDTKNKNKSAYSNN
jgi:hypothetical protein